MNTQTYELHRGRIENYFDRTAADAWARLTSDAPVSRIRATVRAGRNRMRAFLLELLPSDLTGRRVLDAGCGAGALAIEAARRGADVVAVDLSPKLIELARSRAPRDIERQRLQFTVGDMSQAHGRFDHIVAMDSLIHYPLDHALEVLTRLAERAERSIAFTYAPSSPALAVMHAAGRLFPRSDRAPSIEPISPELLHMRIACARPLTPWRCARSVRVAHGFYTSQALELVRT